MGGRGKGGGKLLNTNNHHSKQSSISRRGGSNSKSSLRGGLFIDGGMLADWQLESPSNGHNSGRKLSSDKKYRLEVGNLRNRQVSATGDGARKLSGTEIGYQYPSADLQGTPSAEDSSGDHSLNDPKPLSLLDFTDSQVVTSQEDSADHDNVEYAYTYGATFVLGESSHKGLGFHYKSEVNQAGTGGSREHVEDQSGSGSGVYSSSFEKEVDTNDTVEYEAEGETIEMLPRKLYPVENSGFLAIGGIRLYTQDISEDESDDEDNEEESQGSEEVAISESDSEDTSDTDSDVDEDAADDFLHGIGGSHNIVDAKSSVVPVVTKTDDDGSSRSGFDHMLERLGGMALQEASMEYGMEKAQLRKKYSTPNRHACLSPLDELMLAKDVRTISGKKKHISRFPRSWPAEAQRSKTSRGFPGEKKKHRKEMIAVKRRERMLNHGVDIQKINLKLEQIVVDGVDMFAFQPMHPRDCSQVCRLAAIYRLQSSCQGSGKKRFVTVTRSRYTSMPSASDRLRLEKLVGAGNEDADFSVLDVADRKKVAKGNSFSAPGQIHCTGTITKTSATARRRNKVARDANGSGKRGSYVNQPMSFVSSGVMNSEAVELTSVYVEETDGPNKTGSTSSVSIGSFEVHTKGFGSKMMAKMGYTEGQGLGKDGQGLAAPIEVIQRPKSLGLGMDFSSDVAEPARNKSGVSGDVAQSSKTMLKKIGTFEKHTKGFGSKMMTKMGFVEGMGLGKDAQGMTTPLAAVRLPKSRGLGATTARS